MKKIIFPLFLMLPCGVVFAEVIETVSFNPSRFGQYERLTVSEEADLKGGLSTTNLNVASGGSVDVTVNKPLSDTTAFYVPTVDGVRGNGVRLKEACFSGSGAECKNYDASSATLPNTVSEPLVINSLSGEGSFERDSFLNRVTTTVDALKVKAGQISLSKLTVQGGGGTTYSDETLKGLKLAGNDIPQPVSGYTTKKDGTDGGALTGCELVWESRNTVQKEGKYDTYKILALKNCNSSGGESGNNKCKLVKLRFYFEADKSDYTSMLQSAAKYEGTSGCASENLMTSFANEYYSLDVYSAVSVYFKNVIVGDYIFKPQYILYNGSRIPFDSSIFAYFNLNSEANFATVQYHVMKYSSWGDSEF